MNRELIQKFIEMGNEKLKSQYQLPGKTGDMLLVEDIENLSHLFVLGCIGDKQIKADRAWEIPIKIGQEIGGFEFEKFNSLSKEDMKNIFVSKSLHRFNERVAGEYSDAIELISKRYDGLAKKIWDEENISSAVVVGRFLEFKGVGQKIASMAVNILVRHFKKDIKDMMWIDVSPDVHVHRVFQRTGLIYEGASKEEIIWKCRELYPEYPGVFDVPTFEIGFDICRKSSPKCSECPISDLCPKII
jgi:endonuclease III